MENKNTCLLALAVILGIIVWCVCSHQDVRRETGINNQDYYYILEFANMNREDSYRIPVCKGDVFAVNSRIEKGHVDFIIGEDGRTPIYRGNNLESSAFNVIAPEDGE